MNKEAAFRALGVGVGASWDEVKNRYRKLALASHPDRHPDDAGAADRFRLATEAYETLAGFYPPETRRRTTPTPSPQKGEVLDDIFAEIFEWEKGRAGLKGADWEVPVTIDPEAAVRGVTLKVRVPCVEACGACGGRGAPAATRMFLCRFCFGRGVVERDTRGPCNRCFGRGTVPHTPCPACRGSGRAQKEKSRRVEIPAGMTAGGRISFPGEGGWGWNGGASGDLHLRVAIRAPSHFKGPLETMWHRIKRWLLPGLMLALAVGSLTGCAAGRGAYKSEVTADMRIHYRRAAAEYNDRHLETAENQLMDYVSSYPYNRLTDEAYFKLGEIHFNREDYSNAVWYYRKAISRVYDPKLGPQASYKEAIAQHKLGRSSKAMAALERIPREHLRGPLAVRIYSFWARILRDDGQSPARAYLGLYNTYRLWEPEGAPPAAPWIIAEAEAEHWLSEWIDRPLEEGTGEIKQLQRQFKGSPVGVYPRMKLAVHWWEEGGARKAQSMLVSVLEDYPTHPLADRAKAILDKIGGEVVIRRRQVGVLLPLAGEFGVYGEAVLHGIECAAGLRPPCEPKGQVALVVKESGETAETAGEAARQLVASGVSVVIGPMLAPAMPAAAGVAKAHQIPFITIAKRNGVARAADFIYQNFLTPAAQVRAVVDYWVGKGKGRFAILYPDTEAGKEFADSYEEAVQDVKGDLVFHLPYDPQDPAPVEIADKVPKGSNRPEVIFIPDNYRQVGQIAALLHGAGITDVQFAGTAAWNHPELAAKAGRYLEGAVFADGFFADADDATITKFVGDFETAYGMKPGMLEAYGYDTLLLVAKAMEISGSGKPIDVATALNQRLKVRGLSGWMEVETSGMVHRDLFLFEIKHGQIAPLDR